MICESCRQREATVALTHIVEDGKNTLNLCAACAGTEGTKGAPKPPPAKKAEVELNQVAPTEGAPEATCDACGLTYQAFRKAGRFGCPSCYEALGPPLERLLKRIHGSLQHVGKGTVHDNKPAALPEEDLGRLRQELQAAVADDAFERAAEIRDRIIELEKQTGADAPGAE